MQDYPAFFRSYPDSLLIFERLLRVIEDMGAAQLRVMKSQIVFSRARDFAWVWVPAQYLRRPGLAPLVLTLSFSYRHPSSRWKQIVEPRPGRFVHHLELFAAEDLDYETLGWLREAWDKAI
jgi:hypothetical protein